MPIQETAVALVREIMKDLGGRSNLLHFEACDTEVQDEIVAALEEIAEKHLRAVALEHPGVAALRGLLRTMYRPEQGGGIPLRSPEGRWLFSAIGLGTVTAEQLDALFDLAGLVPKAVEQRGSCRDCRWAKNGKSRGYTYPCSPCTRPWMSNFEPAAGPPPDDRGLVDRLVRRAAGQATEDDIAIDRVPPTTRRPAGPSWDVAAAGERGRDAVVAALDEFLRAIDRPR